MTEPKPLSFDSALVPPANAAGPGTLSFPPAQSPKPAAAPVAGRPLVFPSTPIKPSPRPAPAPVAGRPPSFEGVAASPPRPPHHVTQTRSVHLAVSPICVHAVRQLQTAYPELYTQHEMKVVRQIEQLLPLKLETVLEWGAKTLRRAAEDTDEATALLTEFSTARGAETIGGAVAVITGAVPQGMIARIKHKFTDISTFEPRLAVLQTQYGPWLTRAEQRIKSANEHSLNVLIKSATLAAVVDSIGLIDDANIDRAVGQRRVVLTQGVQQAQLTVKQLEAMRQLVIDQKLEVDRMLDITIPAYKRARR